MPNKRTKSFVINQCHSCLLGTLANKLARIGALDHAIKQMIGKADEELKMTLRGALEKVLHKIIHVPHFTSTTCGEESDKLR